MNRKKIFLVIFILILITAALVIVMYNMLKVQYIYVDGNEKYSDDYIVELSGLEYGESIYGVDEGKVRARIDAPPDLAFVGMEVTLPDIVELTVYEREPALTIYEAGSSVIIDKFGYILSMTEGLVTSYPIIKGISMANMALGNNIGDENEFKIKTMTALYDELARFGLTGDISEIDFLNINAIKLIMRGGITVKLGQADKLGEKLQWAVSVLDDLKKSGISSGTVDVSAGGFATYAPPKEAATPGNATPGNATPGNATPGNATPGNATPGNATPGNT